MAVGRPHRLRVRLAVLAACAIAAQPAQGHVLVTPSAAAPEDPVQFELLVPGERRARTVEVALKIPAGVLPFSFEDRPAWHRVVERADDGSIAVVRWHGDLRRDGFVRFAFLASTPAQEGELVWKAVQRYSDGKDVAWIGPPGSEHPAAVTRVDAAVARRNAGGEGAAPPDGAAQGDGVRALTPSADRDGSDADADWPALALGAGGLALGAIALLVALRGRARTGATRADW